MNDDTVATADTLDPTALPAASKRCGACGETKPLEAFGRDRSRPDGLLWRCKDCGREPNQAASARYRLTRRDDPDFLKRRRALAARSASKPENRERRRAYHAQYYSDPENRKRKLAGDRRRLYGITDDEYERLVAEQGGGCGGCGERWPGWDAPGPAWHVDHDHATGAVRGVLCASCNIAAGHLRDDPDRALGLARYLGRWSLSSSDE
jgi:hypothetical protein